MAITITPSYFTASVARDVHAGNISVSGKTVFPDSTTAQPSIGDVCFLCKIPDQAVIVDFLEDHTTLQATGLDFGLASGTDTGDATYSSLIAAGAISTLNRMSVDNSGGGIKCSLSDSDPNGYGILACKVASGSMSVSVTVNWTVIYRMDGDKLTNT